MLYTLFNKQKKLDCPIVLKQKTATFDDIKLHAELRQRLKESTIIKNLRYARFMERHKISIDFNNLNYTQFIRHMDYRERVENATPDALKHEWKSMRMFLKAYCIDNWSYRAPPAPKPPMRILPFPETVHKFFHFKYSKDNYETKLYQYLFFFGFLVGVRPPSEIVELKIEDVYLDDNGRSYLIVTEPKKYKSKRVVVPEKQIILSRTSKSLKNYIDFWRIKVENQYSDNALFLRPDGRPFSKEYLSRKLSMNGKKIWPYFRPYDMRHWCAVARLIKTKIESKYFDTYHVRNWLGHEKPGTTEDYIRYAEQYYREYPVDWILHAVKARNSLKYFITSI
jgi:integrase